MSVKETKSSASITVADPTIMAVEIDLDSLDLKDDSAGSSSSSTWRPTPSSGRTVAMPRGRRASRPPRPRGEARLVLLPSGAEEEVLTSADISVIGPAPRSPAEDPRPLPVGDPLLGMVIADRYRIVEAIGRGGMGVVYKVEHTRIGKLLAMKLLAGELSSNPEVVRRFKREALTVSRLQCPNTVQVVDFGVSENLTYLVMELVSGEHLGRVLHEEGPMPFARLGKIMIQICSSLAEAHAKGIVHRDIKPENVMLLSAEGADLVKVLDFGLAKLRETEADITNHGTILGTPHYMSPEQVRGEAVDARADVYSLGALMYRVLTGQHVFHGTPLGVLSMHLTETPIPPAERAPDLGIPPGVSRLVMRALRKDPADRFQRVEDLQRLLVEELRAAGSASVDNLLDTGRLRLLARAQPQEARGLATRDDVDAYERKLRRQRFSAMAAGFCAVLLSGTALAAGLLMPHEPAFHGVEVEPNDTAAEATLVPLGQPVRGQLGKRLDETHGDRDFYAVDLPASGFGAPSYLRVRVGPLPNLAMCLLLYRAGFAQALGQYCVGRPGHELVIPALRLEPGRYFLAVLQDLSPSGGVTPFIHESISDSYTLLAEATVPEADTEVEPNDQVASATQLELGRPCAASIGWTRDEDVFCVAAGAPAIRWRVRAASALEVTTIGASEGAPVRVDAAGGSPWQSASIPAEGGSRCLRVRLSAAEASGGSAPYSVEATAP